MKKIENNYNENSTRRKNVKKKNRKQASQPASQRDIGQAVDISSNISYTYSLQYRLQMADIENRSRRFTHSCSNQFHRILLALPYPLILSLHYENSIS